MDYLREVQVCFGMTIAWYMHMHNYRSAKYPAFGAAAHLLYYLIVTRGAHIYRSTQSLFDLCQGILCVYDVTKSLSYDQLSKWMDKAEVKQVKPGGIAWCA